MIAAHTMENLHADARWALVERVLASQQFRRTVRLRDFLRFVADRSIHHPGLPVPEHEVGTAVFHRPSNYDTGADNIVRVSAGDLRRRLEHYFADEGAGERMVCEMRRGGYTLVFLQRDALPGDIAFELSTGISSPSSEMPAPPQPSPAQPSLAQPGAEAVTERSTDTASAPAALPPAAAASFPAPTRRALGSWRLDFRTLALAAACACLVAVCALLLLRHARDPWQQTAPLRQVWAGFFAPGTQTDIVLADSSYAVVRSLTHKQVSLQDYLNYRYRDAASDPSLDPSTQAAVATMLSRNSGSIGDFEAARTILALTRQSSQLVLGSAHDFTPSVVRSSNVVLLGASASNPWVDLYRAQRTLLVEQNPTDSTAEVHNLAVGPGEQPIYRMETGKGDVSGYAVVAILPNIDPEKHVMIIEGTDSQATLAAATFLCSASGASALAQFLHNRQMPQEVEILLRSSKLLATAMDANIVAVHTR